jgi:8-oxo-dGTP pyrophosphatase MutT (NUDIX family)
MVRRNDQVAFMAGAFVFPGGRVDPGDGLQPADDCCDGWENLPVFPDLTAAEEVAFRVAAIRELEEEAAILLARGTNGLVDAEAARRIRVRLGEAAPLASAVKAEGLRFALDALVPIAHWVTPEIEIRRYDTRFFLARLPDGQEAQHDAAETTELAWLNPSDALDRCRSREIMLPPPTWTTLRRLARFESMDEILAWARAASLVRVQPGFVDQGGIKMLTLPGDPLYPAIPGWDVPAETRFLLEEGTGWRAVQA